MGDLEAVVDAVGLQRFALRGVSQGAAIAVAYSAGHDGRTHVHRLPSRDRVVVRRCRSHAVLGAAGSLDRELASLARYAGS